MTAEILILIFWFRFFGSAFPIAACGGKEAVRVEVCRPGVVASPGLATVWFQRQLLKAHALPAADNHALPQPSLTSRQNHQPTSHRTSVHLPGHDQSNTMRFESNAAAGPFVPSPDLETLRTSLNSLCSRFGKPVAALVGLSRRALGAAVAPSGPWRAATDASLLSPFCATPRHPSARCSDHLALVAPASRLVEHIDWHNLVENCKSPPQELVVDGIG